MLTMCTILLHSVIYSQYLLAPCPCVGGTIDKYHTSHRLEAWLSIQGCVSEATGSGSAGATALVLEDITSSGCPDMACGSTDLVSDVESDISVDLFSHTISTSANASADGVEPCTQASISVASNAGVTATGTHSRTAYSGLFRDVGSRVWFAKGHSCCDSTDTIAGVALSSARSTATLNATFDPKCKDAPSVSAAIELDRQKFHEVWICGGPAVANYSFGSQSSSNGADVRFLSLIMTWHPSVGDPEISVAQGVTAELLDDSSVRLGIFDTKEFSEDPLPDDVLVFGTDTLVFEPISVTPVSLTIETRTEAFIGFDGDLNQDGQVCDDDKDIIEGLVKEEVDIDSVDYNPRADFDLDGEIDEDDLDLFLEIYNALPDPNENGIPDACEPTGKCCDSLYGACVVTNELDCQQNCGLYAGDDTDCTSPYCFGDPEIQRACCLAIGVCQVLPECECEALGGTWEPNYNSCNPNPCLQGTEG